MTTIVERLKQYLDSKGISVSSAEKESGISNGTLAKSFNSGTTIKTDTLEKFLNKYTDINPVWLFPMLKSNEYKQHEADITLNEDRENYSNLIPLYNDVSTIGGDKQVANLNPVSSPTEYIDAGDWFPGATAAIRHYDESMLEYPNGCILALKKVNDKTQIVWGKNYCVETDEFRVSKKLQHRDGDKHVWGYSTNLNTHPDGSLIHQPIPIDPDRINKLWLILGCVRKEYSSGVVFVQNGDK